MLAYIENLHDTSDKVISICLGEKRYHNPTRQALTFLYVRKKIETLNVNVICFKALFPV